MKLLHLADLHLGKNIGNYSLIEDQKYVLDQILDIISRENVDIIMIAGDIFDTQVSSVEALSLYSDFIEDIVFNKKKTILAVSGNHDSGKRLDVNSKFYKAKNYHLAGEYKKEMLTFEDEYGKINFHLVPFISLNQASIIFNKDITNFTDLYKEVLKDLAYEDRNVLISHCYANNIAIEDDNLYTEGQKPLTIGGSDAMDAHLFERFDYVALGHLHNRHYVIDPKIRYSGTFMKYSFDEENKTKSVTLVDIKDRVETYDIDIKALRDFRTISGKFSDVIRKSPSDDYIKVILEDESTIENAMAKLKEKFPHIVQISYKNKGIFASDSEFDIDLTGKTAIELFEEFYKFKMDEEMTDDKLKALKKVIE